MEPEVLVLIDIDRDLTYMRILLIDDDCSLVDALTASLKKLHYTVDSVMDGEDGWFYGSTFDYDLIVLDWMIPKLDGIDLCRRFRANGFVVPILLITARSSSSDKVLGLDSGADDYVIKPFDFEEIVARIRALLRRANYNPDPVLTWEFLKLDPRCCEVTYNNKLLSLTATEYALLELFLRRSQHIFSIDSIVDNLWPSGSCPANATVRSHIRGLRNKLKESGASPDVIETVNGIGYRLKPKKRILDATEKDLSTNLANEISQQYNRTDALKSIWQKYKATHLENLDTVERCFCTPIDINDKKLNECRAIVHRLSGTLGTFGFKEASRLSNELEKLLSSVEISRESLSSLCLPVVKAIRNEFERRTQTTDATKDLDVKDRLIVVGNQNTLAQQLLTESLLSANDLDTIILSDLVEAEQLLSRYYYSKGEPQIDRLYGRIVLVILPGILECENEGLSRKESILKGIVSSIPDIKIFLVPRAENRNQHLSLTYPEKLAVCNEILLPGKLAEQILEFFHPLTCNNTLLAIDDDPLFLNMLESILRPSGFSVVTTSDRTDFLKLLNTVRPKLLILDVEMPNVNGLELCQRIRSNPDWCKLPVMFVSAHADPDTQHNAFSVGADDYIAKPIKRDKLLTRILNRLARVKGLQSAIAA